MDIPNWTLQAKIPYLKCDIMALNLSQKIGNLNTYQSM